MIMNHLQPKSDDRQPAHYEGMPPMWAYPQMFHQPQAEEMNFLDYWRVLMKRKWQIALLALLGAAVAFGITLLMPKKYTTEVTLMPITSSGGGGLGALASQVSSMPLVGGALGDIGKMAGGKSKELVNILKSRSLTQKIIAHFDLMKVIFAKQYDPQTNTFHPGFPAFLKPVPVLEDGVARFQKKIAKVEDEKKTTLVKITVTLRDPVLAAKVANQMVAELQDFIENNSLTISKRNRVFLEEQIVKTRVKLLESGKELNQFYSDNRISSVVPQIDVDLGSYQTASKPFAEFQEEFDQLSQKQNEIAAKKEQARVARVPGQVYLQFLNLSRELLIKTYALLTQQYELAKIDEAKEDLAFQVIDKAQVKVRASSPKLIMNVAGGFGAGLILGLFLAFFGEYLRNAKVKEVRKV
jgi:Uncharacterized protein involved in exopolysaccharide biosynthesis